MNPKYRIIKTKSGQYYIQFKGRWFWETYRPIKGPTYFNCFDIAKFKLDEYKSYLASKEEVVYEE